MCCPEIRSTPLFDLQAPFWDSESSLCPQSPGCGRGWAGKFTNSIPSLRPTWLLPGGALLWLCRKDWTSNQQILGASPCVQMAEVSSRNPRPSWNRQSHGLTRLQTRDSEGGFPPSQAGAFGEHPQFSFGWSILLHNREGAQEVKAQQRVLCMRKWHLDCESWSEVCILGCTYLNIYLPSRTVQSHSDMFPLQLLHPHTKMLHILTPRWCVPGLTHRESASRHRLTQSQQCLQ